MQVSADAAHRGRDRAEPLPGTLAFTSRVEGAEVWVGTDRLGETTLNRPLMRDNLPPGSYRVTRPKPGYAPWEQEVQVSAEQRTEVAIELTPLPGTLALTSRVEGVEVWIGTDKLGATTLNRPLVRDNLPPGTYRMTARKPGYAPWEQEVQVSAEQRTDVAIELTPLPGTLALTSRVAGAEGGSAPTDSARPRSAPAHARQPAARQLPHESGEARLCALGAGGAGQRRPAHRGGD